VVAVVLLDFGHHPHHQEQEVAKDRLSRLLGTSLDVDPVVVELFLLKFKGLQHRTINQTCKNLPHWLDTTLKERLLNDFRVDELVEEPLCKLGVIVHVGLQVLHHASNVDFQIGSLHHCNVVRRSKLKHSEFSRLHLLPRVEFVKRQRNIIYELQRLLTGLA